MIGGPEGKCSSANIFCHKALLGTGADDLDPAYRLYSTPYEDVVDYGKPAACGVRNFPPLGPSAVTLQRTFSYARLS